MNRRKGGITIFLSLTLLIIISLIFTVVEAARVGSIRVRAEEVMYMAADSCFSEYGLEIFEEYGLLMLNEGVDEWLSNYNEYVEKNTDVDSILKLKVDSSYTTNVRYITDNGGKEILSQIKSLMKYRLGEDAINALLSKTKSLSEGEETTDFYKKVEETTDVFTNVEESVCKMQNSTQKIKEIDVSPYNRIINLSSKLIEIEKINNKINDKKTAGILSTTDEDEYRIEKENIFFEFKKEYSQYYKEKNKIDKEIKNILNEGEKFKENIDKAGKCIDSLKENLNQKKDKVGDELFSVMKEEVENLDTQIMDADKDSYGVYKTLEYADDFSKQIKSADELLTEFNSNMEGIMYNDLSLKKVEEENPTFISDSKIKIDKAAYHFKEFDSGKLNIFYEKKSISKSDDNIIKFVEKLIDNGVMGIVAGDNISDKKIDIKNMVSKKYLPWNGNKNYTDAAIEKILSGQYIFDYFINYRDNYDKDNNSVKRERPLNYEVEYIAAGKGNDKDNLKYVVDKIIIIRQGFNMLFLLKDNVKREESYAAAVGIVGFTGMPVIIRLTQLLIISAWSYAESVNDAKLLLKGEKIKTFKNNDDWNISMTGIKNIGNDDVNNKKTENGLEYMDYLRFILFTGNTYTQAYRILDMIEANIRNKYNEKFYIENCIIGLTVNSKFKAERLFTAIPFIYEKINNKEKYFQFDKSTKFSY